MQVPDFSQFAPVSKAEAAAALAPAGGVEAPATPITPTAPAAAVLAAPVAISAPVASTAVARFVGGKVRELTIPLDYHVEFEGRTFREITIRRPDSGTVGRFFERLAEISATDPEAMLTLPLYFDEHGEPVPEGLMRVNGPLDEDDRDLIVEASDDFLPGRLRRLVAASQPASR